MNLQKMLLLALVFPSIVFAVDGQIYGTVRDDSTASTIQNVQVKLFLYSVQIDSDNTDSNGEYHFYALAEDLYDLTFTHVDYLEGSEAVFVPDYCQRLRSIPFSPE